MVALDLDCFLEKGRGFSFKCSVALPEQSIYWVLCGDLPGPKCGQANSGPPSRRWCGPLLEYIQSCHFSALLGRSFKHVRQTGSSSEAHSTPESQLNRARDHSHSHPLPFSCLGIARALVWKDGSLLRTWGKSENVIALVSPTVSGNCMQVFGHPCCRLPGVSAAAGKNGHDFLLSEPKFQPVFLLCPTICGFRLLCIVAGFLDEQAAS